MKKFITIASLLTIFTTSSALAKTEGNYLGVYGMLVKVNPKDQSDTIDNVEKKSNRTLRAGFNYQYAFNFNNFFISPEAFIEAVEYTNKSFEMSDKLTINSRYGLKANLGYDVNETVSPYVTLGHSTVEYSSKKSYLQGFNLLESNVSGSKASAIYGLGVNFHISESLTANLEYNKQKAKLDQGDDLGNYAANISAIRFGVAYHF